MTPLATPPRPRPRPLAVAGLLTLLLAACSMDSADTPPDEPTPAQAVPATELASELASEPAPEPAPETALIGAVFWMTDYDAAVARGLARDKPLWVHFGEDPG